MIRRLAKCAELGHVPILACVIMSLVVSPMTGCSGPTPEPTTLAEYAPSVGGFKIVMPGRPEVRRRFLEELQVEGTSHSSQIDAKGFFAVRHREVPGLETSSVADIDDFLARCQRDYIASTMSVVKKESVVLLEDKFRGRSFEAITPTQGSLCKVRFYAVADTCFELVVKGDSDWDGWKYSDEFFSSFRLAR